MIKRIHLLIVGSLALALMLFLGINILKVSSQVSGENLEFIIVPEKGSFLVGEPVKVKFKLINKSDKALTGDFHLRFGFERLKLWIAPSDDPFRVYTSIVMKIAAVERRTSPKPVTLQPGEALETSEFVAFDVTQDQLAFPTAGVYKLKAKHFFDAQDLNKKVESNVAEISVSHPIGKEQEALKFLLENKLERFLTLEGKFFDFDNNTVRKLKEFIKAFPDSAFIPYAQVGLGALCEERPDLQACQPPER